MNTDYRPTNSWDFRLRAAKLGELMSVRSLATLTLTVALIALLATLATLLATPLQAQSLHHVSSTNANRSVVHPTATPFKLRASKRAPTQVATRSPRLKYC